jgi:hypothetical protein
VRGRGPSGTPFPSGELTVRIFMRVGEKDNDQHQIGTEKPQQKQKSLNI